MSVLQKWVVLVLLLVLGVGWLVKRPLPTHAQTGCALRINEIMYHPGPGNSGPGAQEWVELYVASPISANTTYFLTDQETPVANVFGKVFVVPAGTSAGTYIIIHNDGNPNNDGTISNTGIYTTISFFMGNTVSRLANNGDEVVLYQGSAVDGVPCDYVEYLTPNSGVPAGFSWNNGGCGNPSSTQPSGTSISLDPDGTAGNSACDWTESGLNSPNDPGVPITGGPDTQGYNNTTTPTAVTLASFSASTNQPGQTAVIGMTIIMIMLTAQVWHRKRK